MKSPHHEGTSNRYQEGTKKQHLFVLKDKKRCCWYQEGYLVPSFLTFLKGNPTFKEVFPCQNTSQHIATH